MCMDLLAKALVELMVKGDNYARRVEVLQLACC